jgi:hypothetical protein
MSDWLHKKNQEFEEQYRKFSKELEERIIAQMKEEEREYFELHAFVTKVFQDSNIEVNFLNEDKLIKVEDLVLFRVKNLTKEMKLLKENYMIFSCEDYWSKLDENTLAKYLLKHITV